MSKLTIRLSIAALSIAVSSVTLFADDKPIPGLASDVGPTLLQLLGAMLLIIVIIYASVWLMKRYSLGKVVTGGNLITVVERRHLSPKQAIYLIKVGEKHLLIGASESGINKLSDLEQTDIAEPQVSKNPATQSSKFSQVLKQAKSSLMPLLSMKAKSVKA